MAIATIAAVATKPSSIPLLTRKRPKWFFTPLAFCSSSSSASRRKLILYSKPGCCLCDGLKEKLQAAFLLSGPHSLHDVDLQVRDITSNPEWERAYQYEIPVLAKVLSDGTELVTIVNRELRFVFGSGRQIRSSVLNLSERID
ncbi:GLUTAREDOXIN-LIKE PROTEIN C5ORF63-like protein [Salix purpurea]|uniref:Glutaredoxin-like protein n=1 Tax=Salix purpurea TaxID=77065 RepID=A0A9Q0SQ85_SALPP|nr:GLUTAREDOXIN-LIKE PROTEIN C5ORF63-like protein [Salix purpurea]